MHSGHAEKDEVQTHQSAQQAKSMLMMQRRVNEMRQQYMGKQQVKATSEQQGFSNPNRDPIARLHTFTLLSSKVCKAQQASAYMS